MVRGNTRSANRGKATAQSQSPPQKSRGKVPVESPTPKLKNRKSVSSARNKNAQQSQNDENEVVFNQHSWVAFVDASDDIQKFKLAFLIDELREADEDVMADVYHEIAPLVFQKQAAKQTLFSNTIICDVAVVQEKASKKGEKPAVKISKQIANKANKLMEAVVQALENESDSEEDEEDEESESEEEKVPVKNKGKQPAKASIPQTQSQRAQSQATKAQKITKSAQAKKSVPVQRKSTLKNKKESDEDMEEEEEDKSQLEEASEESQVIKTSRKKAAPKSKPLTVPKAGQKRTKNKKKSEDSEEEESEGDEGDDESSNVGVKKMKVANGKEKIIKQTKPKKMPTEFKKGKWNPDIELVKEDRLKESKSNDMIFECCIRCNNKNVIRAAITQNKTLLKKCIEEKKKISCLVSFWSAEDKTTALDIIAENNQDELLEILLHPKLKIPAHSNYDNERNIFFNRAMNPPLLINYVDSGNVSHMAYGAHVRKVGMTRGNRQGNNAFLEYQDQVQNPVNEMYSEKFLEKLLHSDKVTPKFFEQMYKVNANMESYLQTNAYKAVRGGNMKVAHYLIEQMQKYPNFGFNQLHVDVLTDHADLGKILRVSVGKKANTNRDITPLHCACINPNPKYIKLLLDANPDFNLTDNELRKPVHYAAACVGPEPLKILIQAGAGLLDMDNQKMNCLHVAAASGRAHNIRTILQNNAGLLNTRTKKSMTPLAFACKYGHLEAVKVLLEFKGKVNAGAGAIRMTPLIWAAAYGHYELCEYLIGNKGRVLGKDKYKRTALSLASRNGHSKIVSLLLQNGSEWDHADSSNNTPLHYAAAYGWIDNINILLRAGANVNFQNSWKITPINIAMLMNHSGCVKRFLEEPNVDVNGKDEKGRTLLILSLIGLNDDSVEFISYILKKGADPNIKDLEGQTSIHYLAKYNPAQNQLNYNQYAYQHGHSPEREEEFKRKQREEFDKKVAIQKELAQILIQNGVDLAAKDDNKRTAFSIALNNNNVGILEFLQDKVSLNKDPEIFFAFGQKIFNVECQKILERLIKNDPPTKETLNYLNEEGVSPFLFYIQTFTQEYQNLFTWIQNRVNQQSFLYQNETNRYQITNSDLFDQFASQDNWFNYNQQFTQEQKNGLTKKFMEDIVVQPFIKMLKFLVSKGADPCMQVQKLKRYRDEELKKQLVFNGIQEGEDVKMEKEEKIVERRDIKMHGRGKARGAKKSPWGGGFGNNPNLQLQQNNYSHQIAVDKFDYIDGVKTKREYGQNGLRNAIHILTARPWMSIFQFLTSLNVDPDQPDYDRNTPFNILSENHNQEAEQKEFIDKLIDLEVRIDFPNIKGRTAFLNFFEKSLIDLAYTLLALGANVNQMDIGGLFALKYSLLRRNNSQIQELIDKGANINLIDNKGRNLLHHAVNMSSATADATFETELFLIERGVEINLKDQKDRTPLHYAFVKISDWTSTSQIDPIETVSSLCGIKGLELDVPDKWMKTPLHYASQRGASICAMYMIQRGADIEKRDIYGNTPLGVGLTNRHYNYGIILIQKSANVSATVYREDWQKLKIQWEEEQKQAGLYKSKSKTESQLKEETKKQAKPMKKAHHSMFNQKRKAYNDYGDDYGDEDYGNEYDDEEDNEYGLEQHHQNIFNQQNVFGQQVYAKKAPRKAAQWGLGNQQNVFGLNQFGLSAPEQQQTGSLVKETDEGVSLFKLAIRGGQQGLAYLMIDNGYDLMLAMQDAMDEKKFMLVLTLLSKNPNDEVVQSKNKKGQNLFHILSQNASSCSLEHLTRIYEALKKRGVDMKAKDNYGRNALHYSVISQSQALVNLLLSSPDRYDPNEVDNDGHTPLSYCLHGSGASGAFYNGIRLFTNIFMLLAKSGADMNIVYPEKTYKPAFKEEDVDDQYVKDYDPKNNYKCTPLIHVCRINDDNEILCQNIMGLMEFGAKLNIVDSDGRDPLMHAIMNNNQKVVKMLLDNKKSGNLKIANQDKSGKSAVHYVINPIKFGSYENISILKDLHNNGYDLKVKDSLGKSPAHYAAEQESGVLLKELARLTGMQDELQKIQRMTSVVQNKDWPAAKVDFELDAETYAELAEEREKQLAKEDKQRVPVDKTGNFEKSYQVYYDADDKPWDIYLTKVDLKNGIYGDYVFYKLQLLYDTNRDLYVVFTRWGRIGESGMHQRSPFGNADEAKKDFKTIFKQKTGGNDFERLDTFGRIKKKYNIAHVSYIKFNHKDYLSPFEYDKCPKTRLSQSIYDLFEEIANVSLYKEALTQFEIDQDVLPFSGVKKETIVQARQILMEIQEAITEDQNISKDGIKADFEKLTAIKEKTAELTSRYYEIIPLAKYRDSIAPPISNQHMLKQQYDNLEGLSNIQYATKVLLGALLKQKEMNPVDYVYNALNLQIETLDKEGPEFEVLNNYINNTNPNGFQNQYVIGNIFKFQRIGEAEMIQTYKEVPNHFLLYHGSAMFNFIGILSQGLRIAPPEAPPTGHMFGKGLYFADMFEKSFSYSQRGYQQQDSFLMLMCEVVCGKSKELYESTQIEKLDHPFHSVKALGQRGPDYKSTIVMPNGVKIPYGKVINYQKEGQIGAINPYRLQHNEYIVYNNQQVRMRYIVQVVKKDRFKLAK